MQPPLAFLSEAISGFKGTLWGKKYLVSSQLCIVGDWWVWIIAEGVLCCHVDHLAVIDTFFPSTRRFMIGSFKLIFLDHQYAEDLPRYILFAAGCRCCQERCVRGWPWYELTHLLNKPKTEILKILNWYVEEQFWDSGGKGSILITQCNSAKKHKLCCFLPL